MDLLPFQSILPKKVYLNNIVVGRQREASFFVDGNKYEFSFIFPPIEYSPQIFFKIKLSDHILWLSLEQLPPISYFSKKFEGIELEALPEDVQSVVLEACFANILDAVEEELGVVVSLESYLQNHPGNNFDDELPFSVHIKGMQLAIRGALHMEGSSLEFLAALLERSSYIRKNRFSSVGIPLHTIIGEEVLSLKEFRRLDLRDIIFFKDENFFDNGSCKVVIGDHLIYGGVLQNGTLTLENLMDERVEGELTHDESYEFEGEDADGPDFQNGENLKKKPSEGDEEGELEEEEELVEIPREVADIPIRLVFEVGKKNLPIKELQSLKPGYTFELENAVDRPVSIRANGRIIGTGELLNVGDRVGVRVTSFSNK